MYKIYLIDGNYVLLGENEEALGENVSFEGETHDVNYLEMMYTHRIEYCDSEISRLESKALRPQREIAKFSALGMPVDDATVEVLMNIETSLEFLREYRANAVKNLNELLK